MRKITLFLAMLFAFVGWQTANAQVNGEVELTFNRDGQNVTINSNNAAVTAEFVGITGATFRTPDAGNRTSAVLCPDKNANSCAPGEFNVTLKFKITGFTSIGKIGLTVLGLNAGGGYQNADSYVRTWQLDCGLSDTEDGTPTTFATFNQNVTGSVHSLNSEKIDPAIEVAEDGTYLTITINNSQNQYGCFIGLSAIRLTPEMSTAQVTYNYQLDGVTKNTVTVDQGIGTAYAAPALDYDYVTFTQPEGTVPAEGATVNVECTQNLPFTISENFENATWYFMTIRSNDEKYVARSESTPYSNTATVNLSDDGLWAFTGNVFDGIQVINKGAGNGQTLGFEATTNESAIFMKEGNTSWIIEEGNGGFLLRQDGENQYAHDLGSTLKFWVSASAASDPGSAFKVYTASEKLESMLQEWKESTTASLGYVGGYPTSMAETINAISTYADAVAFDEANATSKIALIPGNYYRVQNVLRERMIGVNAAGQRVPTTIGKADASQIWTFETGAEDGKYYIKNLNGGDNGYMKAPGGGNDLTTVDAATLYTLTDLGEAQFNLGNGSDLLVDYGGDKGLGVWWDNGKGSDGAWYIIPATELEVALNVVEGASYATGYYPFPVSASGNTTLNVGVLNADKSKLGLTAAEGVPTNTGVVIVNSAAEPTATLTIGGEYAAAGSNALTGSCTAVTENIANYLVLGVGANTGALGFYETTATEIPANKAFLEAGNLSAVKLDLGGDVTAIENAELGNTNAPIFDLSGRRVLVPAKGGVYIQGGKKFIVK